MTITVSVLVDRYSLRAWEARALQRLSDCHDVKVTDVVVNTETDDLVDLVSKILDQGLWGVYRAVQEVTDSIFGRPEQIRPVGIDEIACLSNADILACRPKPASPFGNELADEAIASLRGTDVCIRFGFGIVVGEALTAPAFGMVSYHHGDLEEYRGRPAGFWEMHQGESTVGITVQRLAESLDGGDIVAEKTVSIDQYCRWRSALDALYDASDSLLPEAIEAIREQDVRKPQTLGELYTTPDWRTTFRFLAKQHLECLRKRLRGLSNRVANRWK